MAITLTLRDIQARILSLLGLQNSIPVIVFYKMLFEVLTEDRAAREALSAAFKTKYHL